MKRLAFRTDGRSGQHVAQTSEHYVVITWIGDRFEVEFTSAPADTKQGRYSYTRLAYRRTYKAAVAAAVRMAS